MYKDERVDVTHSTTLIPLLLFHVNFYNPRGLTYWKVYKQIGLRGLGALTKATFMAHTASAPPATCSCRNITFSVTQPVVVMHRLNRENIYLSISKKQAIAVSQTVYM